MMYYFIGRALCSALVVFLLIYAAWPVLKGVLNVPVQNTGGVTASDLPLLDRFPDLPIVEPVWHDYVRVDLFGPTNLKERMVLVVEPADLKAETNFALSTEAVHRAMNVPEARYEQFVASHSQFLLLGAGLRHQLVQDGRKVMLVGKIFQWDLYLVSESKD